MKPNETKGKTLDAIMVLWGKKVSEPYSDDGRLHYRSRIDGL